MHKARSSTVLKKPQTTDSVVPKVGSKTSGAYQSLQSNSVCYCGFSLQSGRGSDHAGFDEPGDYAERAAEDDIVGCRQSLQARSDGAVGRHGITILCGVSGAA